MNTCFSGQCMYVPDDTKCDMTQFCSAKDGCTVRQACGILVGEDPTKACDDGSSCTTDSCVKNLCQHDFCAQGKLCCEGTGCADRCCNDSQCNTGNDPCKVGSCKGNKCSLVALCGDGQQCCPSADAKTATCAPSGPGSVLQRDRLRRQDRLHRRQMRRRPMQQHAEKRPHARWASFCDVAQKTCAIIARLHRQQRLPNRRLSDQPAMQRRHLPVRRLHEPDQPSAAAPAALSAVATPSATTTLLAPKMRVRPMAARTRQNSTSCAQGQTCDANLGFT